MTFGNNVLWGLMYGVQNSWAEHRGSSRYSDSRKAVCRLHSELLRPRPLPPHITSPGPLFLLRWADLSFLLELGGGTTLRV